MNKALIFNNKNKEQRLNHLAGNNNFGIKRASSFSLMLRKISILSLAIYLVMFFAPIKVAAVGVLYTESDGTTIIPGNVRMDGDVSFEGGAQTGDIIFSMPDPATDITMTWPNSSGTIALTGGLFNAGGDTTGAARDIGNDDNFALNLETSNVDRISIAGAGDVVVNETGAAADFRVESDGQDDMFFVDGTNNAVGINTTSPVTFAQLDVRDNPLIGFGEGLSLSAVRSGGGSLGTGSIIKFVMNDSADNSPEIGAYISGTWETATSGSEAGLLDFRTMNNGGPATTSMMAMSQSGISINSGSTDVDTIIRGDNDANLLHIDAGNDRVGISTATPDATLDLEGTFQYVDGNQSNGFVLTSDGSGNATWQAASGGGDFSDGGDTASGTRSLGNISSHDMQFETANTARMHIEGDGTGSTAGFVGIATTTPATMLDVFGGHVTANQFISRTNGNSFQAVTGTVSQPAYTFTTDLDTGLHSPGANQLTVATGGTERMLFFADPGGARMRRNGDLDSGAVLQLISENQGTIQTRGLRLDREDSNTLNTPLRNGIAFHFEDSIGVLANPIAMIDVRQTNGTSGSQTSEIDFTVLTAGSSLTPLTIDDRAARPGGDSTFDLGTSSERWRDVYFDDLDVADNVILGSADTDNITVNAGIQGTNALVFEGSSDDGVTTTFAITNPTTTDKTITFPNSSGTVPVPSDGEGTSGQVLTSNGAGVAPTWEDAAGGSSLFTDGGTFTYLTDASEDFGLGGNSVATFDTLIEDTGAATFNNQQNATGDFLIQGDDALDDDSDNLLFVDASTAQVAIRTNSPTADLTVFHQTAAIDAQDVGIDVITRGNSLQMRHSFQPSQIRGTLGIHSNSGRPYLMFNAENSPFSFSSGDGYTSSGHANSARPIGFEHNSGDLLQIVRMATKAASTNFTPDPFVTFDGANERVGINRTAPNTDLEVAGSIGAGDGSLGASATPAYGFYNDFGLGINRAAVDTMSFVTAGVERGAWDASGNFLVGDTASASADVLIDQNGRLIVNQQGNATGDFIVEGDTNANLIFVDAGTDTVTIGGVPDGTHTFEVDGTSELNGAVTVNSGDLTVSGNDVLVDFATAGTADRLIGATGGATPNHIVFDSNSGTTVTSGASMRFNIDSNNLSNAVEFQWYNDSEAYIVDAANDLLMTLTDEGLLTPGSDNAQDFGTAALSWQDGFFDGTVTAGTFSGSGASLTSNTVPVAAVNTTGSTSGHVLTSNGSGVAPSFQAVSSGVTDHGALTGLTDDDHTQYALLAGRSGGQTLIGSTLTTENLTLDANAADTTGEIIVSSSQALTLENFGSTAGQATELRFEEVTDATGNYVGFQSPNAIASNVIWTLPDEDGTNGQALVTNGTGTLSWGSTGSDNDWAISAPTVSFGTGITQAQMKTTSRTNNVAEVEGAVIGGGIADVLVISNINNSGSNGGVVDMGASLRIDIESDNGTNNEAFQITGAWDDVTTDAEISSGRFYTKEAGSDTLVEQMRIDDTGLGIGLTNPSSALDVSGVIEVSNGSESAPAYTFGSSTNTGMYNGSGLEFAVGGVDVLKLTQVSGDANVGIGTETVSSGAILDIESASALDEGVDINVTGGGAPTIRFQTGGNTRKIMGLDGTGFAIGNSTLTSSTLLFEVLDSGDTGIGPAPTGTVQPFPNTKLDINDESSVTNTFVDVVTVGVSSTGTVTGGYGPAIQFAAENAGGGVDEDIGRIAFTYNDASATSEDTRIGWWQKVAGTLTEKMTLTAITGAATEYGALGVNTNSPRAQLDVVRNSASGGVLETARLTREALSGAGSDGIGSSLAFVAETNSAGTNALAADIAGVLSSAINGSQQGELRMGTIALGDTTTTQALRINSEQDVDLGLPTVAGDLAGVPAVAARLEVYDTDANTDVKEVLRLSRSENDRNGFADLGVGMGFALEGGSGNLVQAASINAVTVDPSELSYDASLIFNTSTNNSVTEAMRITNLNDVLIGTTTGTSTLTLGATGSTATLQYVDGNQSNGFVLTSDANGNATWQAASGGGSSEWTDNSGTLHPADSSGAQPVVIGGTDVAGGDIILNSTGEAIFNEQGAAVDFRVETAGDANALVVDDTNDAVGVGTASPVSKFEVNGGATLADETCTSAKAGMIVVNDCTPKWCGPDGLLRSLKTGKLDRAVRAFVSSTEYDGDLGGIAGANAKCQARAEAANLGGRWFAVLSWEDGTVDLDADLQADDLTAYRTVTDTTITTACNRLWDTTVNLAAAINVDETGAAGALGTDVWTGSTNAGNVNSGNTCSNWTSNAGGVNGAFGTRTAVDGNSTAAGTQACNLTAHLYCVEAI